MKKVQPISTIVIPVYNGEGTLEHVLDSLDGLAEKELVDKIIIINDKSTDASKNIIEHFVSNTKFRVSVINRKVNKGLAAGYNEGLQMSSTPYVIFVHQDIVATQPRSISMLLKPFDISGVVATYPHLEHSLDKWKTYGFWQKCLFSRFVGADIADLCGKFDAFDRIAIMKLGMFDNTHFRTAGEDADMKIRISAAHMRYGLSDVVVSHIAKAENIPLKKLFSKEKQLAEARGTILRANGIRNINEFVRNFFRELMFINLFIPYSQILSILAIIIYCFAYTAKVYRYSYGNVRIIALPFINLYLLPVALISSIKGFVLNAQTN